jgi:hypothetical protein
MTRELSTGSKVSGEHNGERVVGEVTDIHIDGKTCLVVFETTDGKTLQAKESEITNLSGSGNGETETKTLSEPFSRNGKANQIQANGFSD